MKGIVVLRVAFLLAIFAISLPRGFAQGGTPVFQHRYVPPPAETPVRGYIPESEPIPQGWIFAGQAVAVLIGAALLIAATRAWHASNIFGRQYRFPSTEPGESAESAERRFGGNRSGGFMAVIEPAREKKDA